MGNTVGIYNITSNDTLMLKGLVNGALVQQLFITLSDKSVVHIDVPNDLVNVTIGKNGNGVFAAMKKGQIGDMELRPLMANADHNFLNAQLAQWLANPTAFVLLNGVFTKVFGDGLGNTRRFTYQLNGGVPLKNIVATENVEGETDQAIAIFKLRFAQIIPVID
ncbi:MAG TPA: hypothetical protein VMT55_00100 [Candidatus Sulfotelmatobacter sp.]|nr:hypothetical protein [Candidatus Sulfotelmatobacter sp.]